MRKLLQVLLRRLQQFILVRTDRALASFLEHSVLQQLDLRMQLLFLLAHELLNLRYNFELLLRKLEDVLDVQLAHG